MSDQTEITEAIVTNATGSKSTSVDGQSETAHDLSQQIEVLKFLSAQNAVNSEGGIIRCRRSKPPGASGLHS